MKIEFLGTGTSHGIPVINCGCGTCRSRDERDRRFRASLLIRGDEGERVLIDCGPEFRLQALRARLDGLDGILFTHSHADHLHGLDDVRIFCCRETLPVYGNENTIADIKRRFEYIFLETQEGGGKPHISLNVARGSVAIGSIEFIPVPITHGALSVSGWRWKNCAYLTDCDHIPESSYALLKGVDYLIIDALRWREHSTHFNFEQALNEIERIGPKNAWFTHICHDGTWEKINEWTQKEIAARTSLKDKKIEPAWDGLVFSI